MHLISGNTLSSTTLQLYNKILSDGHYQESRNGGSTSLHDVTLEITNPRSRHLSLEGRNSNIIAMIAETFWVMAGLENVDPYLSYFLPRAPQYSDNGKTWHGAYGPRIYQHNQHIDALRAFIDDGLYTRRSFITISDPTQDCASNIAELYGDGHKAKDIPCNRELNFYVEKGDQFVCKAIQRSGDAIFGTGSINPFEFSFIHELMFNEVKSRYPDIKLGAYRWHVTNAHLYDFSKSQAEDAVTKTSNYHTSSVNENDMPLIGPDIDSWQDFFSVIVTLFTDIISTNRFDKFGGDEIIHRVWDIFRDFEVPIQGNLLYEYVTLVLQYITNKEQIPQQEVINVSNYDAELKHAIVNSKFVKFPYFNLEIDV